MVVEITQIFNQGQILLKVYQPLIPDDKSWLGRTIALWYEQGVVFAEIFAERTSDWLPVKGYPAFLSTDPYRLRRYFSHTRPVFKKLEDGSCDHLETVHSLNGGGVEGPDILPMYPGYALGGIIPKKVLELASYQRSLEKLQDSIKDQRSKRLELDGSESYLKESKEVQLGMRDTRDLALAQSIREHQHVFTQIGKLRKDEADSPLLFSAIETLPIDYSLSKMRIENLGFESEVLDHLIFTKKEAQQLGQLQEQVDRFISRLFLKAASSVFLPSNMLEGVTQGIKEVLQTESQVSLVASFIELYRVRVFDPIVIRKGAQISSELKKNAADYLVLSGAVLGAVFLGIGRHASQSTQDPLEGKRSNEEVMSSFSTVSFISQGAIPKTNRDANDVNLWSVYNNWKDVLLKDPNTGYPIAFKTRKLQDVLKENNLS